MQLEAFSVRGWQSLASTDEIPVRSPTILTGANDGGKTASISALEFLLGGRLPEADVRTWARDEDDPPGGVDAAGRFAEVCVVGRFSLDPAEQDEFTLPSRVLIRRRLDAERGALFELHKDVPADERLQALSEDLRLAELKQRAMALDVEAEGRATAKASFLAPLQRLAESAPKVTAWIEAPSALIHQLPRFLSFSSSREPNPESEIRTILRDEYTRILEDPALVGALTDIEEDVRTRLQEEADDLREHIRSRIPELAEISIVPAISFSGGFQGASLLTSTGVGEDVPLAGVGSGRRRRMTLAIWEWASGVLADSPDTMVIAYDEPDTHLDYSRQRDLVDLVRSQAANPHVRVVLATHSLNLIDKVDIADVVHLTLDEGRTEVHRLPDTGHEETNKYLSDVAAAMGLRNSVLLHERCFLGVEGATESQALPALFRLVTGHSFQAAGIALVPGNGNIGALELARFLNGQGRQVSFIVDADSSRAKGSRKLFRPHKLRARGVRDDQIHLVGNPGEIEDLFSDDQWCTAANKHWPRSDGVAWESGDFAALRTGDGFSRRLVELIRSQSEEAPAGKPGYLAALVVGLTSRDEVPAQLRQVLTEVFEACDQ